MDSHILAVKQSPVQGDDWKTRRGANLWGYPDGVIRGFSAGFFQPAAVDDPAGRVGGLSYVFDPRHHSLGIPAFMLLMMN